MAFLSEREVFFCFKIEEKLDWTFSDATLTRMERNRKRRIQWVWVSVSFNHLPTRLQVTQLQIKSDENERNLPLLSAIQIYFPVEFQFALGRLKD